MKLSPVETRPHYAVRIKKRHDLLGAASRSRLSFWHLLFRLSKERLHWNKVRKRRPSPPFFVGNWKRQRCLSRKSTKIPEGFVIGRIHVTPPASWGVVRMQIASYIFRRRLSFFPRAVSCSLCWKRACRATFENRCSKRGSRQSWLHLAQASSSAILKDISSTYLSDGTVLGKSGERLHRRAA